MVEDFLPEFVSGFEGLLVVVFPESIGKNNLEHFIEVDPFALVDLINSRADILEIVVFEVSCQMVIGNLINLAFVVQIDAFLGDVAVNVFVKVLKLLDDTLQTERNLLRSIWRRDVFVECSVDGVEKGSDIRLFRQEFLLDKSHFFLLRSLLLRYSLDGLSIQVIQFR